MAKKDRLRQREKETNTETHGQRGAGMETDGGRKTRVGWHRNKDRETKRNSEAGREAELARCRGEAKGRPGRVRVG